MRDTVGVVRGVGAGSGGRECAKGKKEARAKLRGQEESGSVGYLLGQGSEGPMQVTWSVNFPLKFQFLSL